MTKKIGRHLCLFPFDSPQTPIPFFASILGWLNKKSTASSKNEISKFSLKMLYLISNCSFVFYCSSYSVWGQKIMKFDWSVFYALLNSFDMIKVLMLQRFEYNWIEWKCNFRIKWNILRLGHLLFIRCAVVICMIKWFFNYLNQTFWKF